MPSAAQLIADYGYYVVFIFIFIETALLVGFFLPGDSLLLFAGYYASTGRLNVGLVILVACIAAVSGDTIAYTIGKRGGRKLFKKEDSIFFSVNHLKRAEIFFEKHGPITVLIARPIAFLRTFAPVVAGIGQMNYKKFLAYNIVGGVLWVVVFTYIGWGVAEFLKDKVNIEQVNKWVDIVTYGILIASIGSFVSLYFYKKLTAGKPKGLHKLKKELKK